MVETTLRWLTDAWQSLLVTLSPLGVIALLVVIIPLLVALVRAVLERDGLTRSRDWIAQIGPRWLSWLPLGVLLIIAFGALGLARESVQQRLQTQATARFSRLPDPPGGATVQLNPKVTYTKEARYTRSIKIPNDVLKRFDQDGPEVLQGFIAPYLSEPQSKNVKTYLDSIVRNGRSIFLVRESSILEERQIELENADVRVDLTPGETGAGRPYYRADFEGKYAFKNTLTEARDVRLRFPLPQNSGTITGFEFRVGNDVAKTPNENGEFVWQRQLAPNERVEVTVRYQNQGSGVWSYQFGNYREPVRNFKLTLNAPTSVKFLRGGLYPDAQTNSSYTWTLKDVITSQAVVIGFPPSSSRETLQKVFAFMPLAVPVLLGWRMLFGWRRQWPLVPWRIFVGGLGFTLGLALTGVFVGYAPVWLACILGFALASSLALLALGRGYALPVILSALTPFAFLWVGNAGLLLGVIAVVLVISVLPADAFTALRRPPTRPMTSG